MPTDKKTASTPKNNVPPKEDKLKKNKEGIDHTSSKPAGNHKNETEGERRFKEGMVNNSDTDE